MNCKLYVKYFYAFIINIFVYDECESAHILLKDDNQLFETRFPLPTLDGSGIIGRFSYISVKNREGNEENIPLNTVTNFQNLTVLNITNFNLNMVPKFINVSVYSLEIPYNNLKNITIESLSEIPMATRLNYNANQIEKIENESFGVNVQMLFLNCNLLKDITINWFQNPSRLRYLYVRNNKISYIKENFLNRFHSIRIFDLTRNQIKRIGDGAFVGPSNIGFISLQENQLTELQSNLFAKDTYLTIFNIANNRLNYLSQDLLNKLRMNLLIMFGNPWQCSCYKKIKRWLTEKQIVSNLENNNFMKWSENNPVCISPLSFQQICVENVDEELYNTYIRSDIEPLQFLINICDVK